MTRNDGDAKRLAPAPLGDDVLRTIDAYWRAANYLSVGQIYLLGTPLLRAPRLPRDSARRVFDTAFHVTMRDEAALYAVPRPWREDWGIRRFGFHGLSVAWCAERARNETAQPDCEVAAAAAAVRIVVVRAREEIVVARAARAALAAH